MSPRYPITLTEQERKALEAVTKRGKTQARNVMQARALLLCDTGAGDQAWTVAKTAEALGISVRTIEHLKKRVLEEGLEAVLARTPREKPPRNVTFDGAFEAQLIALARSEVPAGHRRWTVRLLAAKIVELKVVESVSHMTIQRALTKARVSLIAARTGASPPDGNAALVATTELAVKHLPNDPDDPVVCRDASCTQGIDVHEPIPGATGRPTRLDDD